MSEVQVDKLGRHSFRVHYNQETFRCWRARENLPWSVGQELSTGETVVLVQKMFRNIKQCFKYIQGGAVQGWMKETTRGAA
jgi:hypothetical protein